MNSKHKEQLLQSFQDYLAQIDEPQIDEAGADAVDLYSLFTELSALKAEVRLESRQLKDAVDQFRELFNSLEEHKQQLQSELERCHQNSQRTHALAERDLLVGIIELRDRIDAGLHSTQQYQPSLLARASRRNMLLLESLHEGQKITLRRLDELLSRYQVLPIETLGVSVDPHTMRVHSVTKHPEYEDGQVTEEITKGFRRGEDILRTAEVIVNKVKEPA
jgi:molecular chaperone GrpE